METRNEIDVLGVVGTNGEYHLTYQDFYYALVINNEANLTIYGEPIAVYLARKAISVDALWILFTLFDEGHIYYVGVLREIINNKNCTEGLKKVCEEELMTIPQSIKACTEPPAPEPPTDDINSIISYYLNPR